MRKASAEGRDECQVCEGHYALRGGLLVHHGFKRPGIGVIVGDCRGVKRKPFPTWDALAEYRVEIVNALKIHKKLLAELPNVAVFSKVEERFKKDDAGNVIRDDRMRFVREVVTVTIPKPEKPFVSSSGSWSAEDHKLWSAWDRWNRQLSYETKKLESEIKSLERERDRVVGRIEKAQSSIIKKG